MKNNNICKFPLSNVENSIDISCFVFETNLENMKTLNKLQTLRFILIEHGNGTFLFDKTPCDFTVGDVIFGFENEDFLLQSGNDVRYFYINFSGVRAISLCRRLNVNPTTRKVKNLNSLIPFCKDCLFNTSPEHVDIAAESLLLYIFSRLSSNVTVQNDTLQKILDFIEDNYTNPTLSLETIAKVLGYNVKYVSHFFKEKMKVSYSEYLSSLRFKYAIFLFEHGVNSIKNVAYLSGFSDPLYFSSAFKKSVGISPKEFIARIEKK